jgi:hypothetical protein
MSQRMRQDQQRAAMSQMGAHPGLVANPQMMNMQMAYQNPAMRGMPNGVMSMTEAEMAAMSNGQLSDKVIISNISNFDKPLCVFRRDIRF